MHRRKWRIIARSTVAPLVIAGTLLGMGAGVAHAAGCTGGQVLTSTSGSCGSQPSVSDNMWNWNGTGEAQIGIGTSSTNWTFTAKNFNSSDYGSYGAGPHVLGYPEDVYNYWGTESGGVYPGTALTAYNDIDSSWSSTMPETAGSGSYEAAYDIWLGNEPGSPAGSASSYEVMIWTNDYGQSPGGTDVGTWTDPTTGDEFTVYDSTPAVGHTMWFVPTAAVSSGDWEGGYASGSVDIGDALYASQYTFDWLGSDHLYSIDYGFEIDSAGSDTLLTLNRLSVTTPTASSVGLDVADLNPQAFLRVTGTSPAYLWVPTASGDWHIPDGAVLTFMEKAGFQSNEDVISQTQFDEATEDPYPTNEKDCGSACATTNNRPVDGTFVRVSGTSPVYWWNGANLYHIPSVAVLTYLEDAGVGDGKGEKILADEWDLQSLGPVIS